MNNRTNQAGSVDHEHILSHGFEVYKVIKGNDMGQMTYEMPQYKRKSDGLKITDGYWGYDIEDKDGNILVEYIWWNSNEEFDQTMKEIEDEYEQK